VGSGKGRTLSKTDQKMKLRDYTAAEKAAAIRLTLEMGACGCGEVAQIIGCDHSDSDNSNRYCSTIVVVHMCVNHCTVNRNSRGEQGVKRGLELLCVCGSCVLVCALYSVLFAKTL